MSPTVAVLTPAYNAGRYLGQAIQSVQAQTYPHWRLVIVDDGSMDDTLAVARQHAAADPRISVHTQANRGLSATRNETLRLMPRDCAYVINLDADDLLEASALEDLVRHLESYPEAGAVLCATVLIDQTGKRQGRRRTARFRFRMGMPARLRQTGEVPFFNLYCAYGVGPFALLRRTALDEIGPINESLRYFADVDMFIRIGLISQVHLLAKPLYLYRWHGGNMSQYTEAMENEMKTFYADWDRVPGRNRDEQRLLQQARHFRKHWDPLILRGKLISAYFRQALRSRRPGRVVKESFNLLCWFTAWAISCLRGLTRSITVS